MIAWFVYPDKRGNQGIVYHFMVMLLIKSLHFTTTDEKISEKQNGHTRSPVCPIVIAPPAGNKSGGALATIGPTAD